MKSYVISPLFNFKRAFSKYYAEHKCTKHIVFFPEEVYEIFLDPSHQLMGFEEDHLLTIISNELLHVLIDKTILVDSNTKFKDLSAQYVVPQYTYLGLPFGTLEDTEHSLVILGVPYTLGSPKPLDLINSSNIARNYSHKYNLTKDSLTLSGEIRNQHYEFAESERIFDLGDLYINQREDNSVSQKKILDSAFEIIKNNNKFIAIGGDHSVTYPLFKGAQKHIKELTCIHIDAHNDIFMLTECHFQDLAPSHSSVIGKLLKDGIRVHSVGLRDFVNKDSIYIKKCSNYSYDFASSDDSFNSKLMNIIEAFGNKKVYLSIDIDVLSPNVFSSVTDPLPGGISFGTLTNFVSELNQQLDIVAIDVVEAALKVDKPIDVHNFLNFLIDIIESSYEFDK